MRLILVKAWHSGKKVVSCEYGFSASLRTEDGHWPRGAYRLNLYDAANMLVTEVTLSDAATATPQRRLLARPSMQVRLRLSRAELLFTEVAPGTEVAMDLSEEVALDPRIDAAKLAVESIRLARSSPPDANLHEYEFSAALLRRGRTWTEGDFRLDLYDRSGRLLTWRDHGTGHARETVFRGRACRR